VGTPLALNIRDERSADVRAFVPIKPEPVQIIDDRIGKFSAAAIAIQIFDPQNEPTAGFAGTFLRPPECHCVTNVQKARRRWCDTAAVFLIRHPEQKSSDLVEVTLKIRGGIPRLSLGMTTRTRAIFIFCHSERSQGIASYFQKIIRDVSIALDMTKK